MVQPNPCLMNEMTSFQFPRFKPVGERELNPFEPKRATADGGLTHHLVREEDRQRRPPKISHPIISTGPPNLAAKPHERISLTLPGGRLRTSTRATRPDREGTPTGGCLAGRKDEIEPGHPEERPCSMDRSRGQRERDSHREAVWPIFMHSRQRRGSLHLAARWPLSKHLKKRPLREGLRRNFDG